MTDSVKLNVFNCWAATYDWLLPSVFYQAVHQRLLEYVRLPKDPHILDLGCGTGKLLNRLATHYSQLTGIGLDFSPEMLNQARQKSVDPERLHYVQGKTDQIPYPENQFDAVFCSISFLHYPDAIAVMQEIYRVLKPGGMFYLVDYAPPKVCGQDTLIIPAGDLRFYSQRTREELGRQVALVTEAHDYLIGPVMLTIYAKPSQTE